MLNEKAVEAAMVAYFDGEHSWRTGLSNFIAERTEGAMSDAITAYLEALLPADEKTVLQQLERVANETADAWPEWSQTTWKAYGLINVMALNEQQNAALLQAQAAREAAKDARIAELEDEVSEARQVWPEWAKRIYSFMRKQGYYEGAEDDIHLPDDLEEWFDEAINTEIDRRARTLSKKGRDNG